MTYVASVSFSVYTLLPFHVFAFLRGKSIPSIPNPRCAASPRYEKLYYMTLNSLNDYAQIPHSATTAAIHVMPRSCSFGFAVRLSSETCLSIR